MDNLSRIRELAKRKKAIILAHNYQRPEIQDLADYTGDSLELSRIAAAKGKEDAFDVIVFCGVHFMAESASILSPDKKVLLPEPAAGCPMADMATAEDVVAMKKEHPGAKVVTYINSSAAVKAVSDTVCTSANAQLIVDRIDADEIIFVPDKNLGSYVQRFTKKKIHLWKGFCPVHEVFTLEQLLLIKKQHPHALVMVHPECRPEVIDAADKVLSTGQMVNFVRSTDAMTIIVGTEKDMIHRLKKEAPHITFIPASDRFTCPNMKKIDYDVLVRSMEAEQFLINVDLEIRRKAKLALDSMLELSK